MTDEIVTRLYSALVEALQRRGHQPGDPVRVSEIYQDLVPYRSVRSRLGVELNADYQHAMLRLLAGEGELVRLEPADARDELRREASSPYPDVGLFRQFSASHAMVTFPDGDAEEHATTRLGLESDSEVETDDRTDPDRAAPPERASVGSASDCDEAPASEPATLTLHTGSEPAVAVATCRFCDEALPPGRDVMFCPYCGGDQRLRPCPRCGAILEGDWEYCISCGREVTGS